MGERICRECIHFQPGQLLFAGGYTGPKCKRTAHRDLVHGTGLEFCSVERISDDHVDYCSDVGRHWVQRPEPAPKVEPPKKRRWWQFGAQP